MPLGTLDRTPPPFFRQGMSATSKLVFFSALAIFLMVADARFKMVEPLRSGLAMVLLPVQRTLLLPLEIAQGGAGYLQGLTSAQQAERRAREQLIAQSERAARTDVLAAENDKLRALMGLKPALQVRSQAAEILYEAADPFTRKVFIDRGRVQGIALGSPVIDERGVFGQVTRVYALSAEVTLPVDKDAAIPVLNPRTQQRGAAFGAGDGMELRFMPAMADIQVGDVLTTSGVDGVYPPGLPVAKVTAVERAGGHGGFARIVLQPVAQSEGVRHVLVLEPLAVQMAERPDAAAASASAAASAPPSERASARTADDRASAPRSTAP